jgi:catechol 2,3-dioxygenase-like lactoylglutathione lyase family enzyme
MSVELNHTIIHAKDKAQSAHFLSEILGLAKPETFFHFLVVKVANGVSLDFLSTDESIQIQHYAFLVGENEFDQIFERIKSRGLKFWADPATSREGQINTNDGGRSLYFKDPSGHVLEIITRPYGSGS